MTPTMIMPQDETRPVQLISWLSEDGLMHEIVEDQDSWSWPDGIPCWDENLSEDPEMDRIVNEMVRDYQTPSGLAREIERELDALTMAISRKLPTGRLQEAARELQEPGEYEPWVIPHEPTSETLLHQLLSQEGELLPGNQWVSEDEIRQIAPDLFWAAREAAEAFSPGDHVLDEISREMGYLVCQAMDALIEARNPSDTASAVET